MFSTPVLQRIEVDSMQLHEMYMGFTSILQILSGMKFYISCSCTFLEMACTRLGVNLTEAVLNPRAVNFSNPMVSGVIATFYIHYVVTVKKKTIPPAENVTEQAMFWLSEYKMNDTAITLSHFTERVEELKGMVYI